MSLAYAGENCNNISATQVIFQPQPLWQIIGYRLAQDYKTQSQRDRVSLIQRWITELPEDACKKIRLSDPLVFLKFEKADWLMKHVHSTSDLTRSSSGNIGVFVKQVNGNCIYQICDFINKKIIKEIELNNSLATWIWISDRMFVWSQNNHSQISIFDIPSKKHYKAYLPNEFYYCLPSDHELGVLYLFDGGSDKNSFKKIIRKVCCHLDSEKYEMQDIDVSFFSEKIGATTFIQTNQLDRYILQNGNKGYLYDTQKNSISPLSMDFEFDEILPTSNAACVVFYTKSRESSPIIWRIFSVDDLKVTISELSIAQSFYSYLNIGALPQFLFFEHPRSVSVVHHNEVRNIGNYTPRIGINMAQCGSHKSLCSRIVCDNDNNFCTLTDAFTQQREMKTIFIENQNN
jgi:hypothetical protein